MSRFKLKTMRAICFGLILLLVGTITACVHHVDPGPNPALVQVTVRAGLNPAQVNAARQSHLREVRGPYWVWNLYTLREDGTYLALKPAEKGPKYWSEGMSLQDAVDFLAPTGHYRVRLRVTAYMDYEMNDGGGTYTRSVALQDWESDVVLEAKPGERISIIREYGE
jgi:hypothetical protein